MRRLIFAIGVCFMTFPAFCQPRPQYQVATIVEAKPHPAAAGASTGAAAYDVSVKVGNTIYVVLYTPPLGENTVRYASGRELLVLVGSKTITYNDLLGRSFEVPIESQRPATGSKSSK